MNEPKKRLWGVLENYIVASVKVVGTRLKKLGASLVSRKPSCPPPRSRTLDKHTFPSSQVQHIYPFQVSKSFSQVSPSTPKLLTINLKKSIELIFKSHSKSYSKSLKVSHRIIQQVIRKVSQKVTQSCFCQSHSKSQVSNSHTQKLW